MTKRDNEKLWQLIKDTIMSIEIAGTKAHQWSARKAQLAVRLYKENGGGYIGAKDKDNSLTRWTAQNWRTKSGLPSSVTGERYLPYEAIKHLTPQQYNETTKEKQRAMMAGNQYSSQPVNIAQITRRFR
jgi:hypothetical protein